MALAFQGHNVALVEDLDLPDEKLLDTPEVNNFDRCSCIGWWKLFILDLSEGIRTGFSIECP